MFENLKNLGALMGQAKEMRAKMEQMQAELVRKRVEAEAGAGAVRVVMNGKFEVVDLQLDRPLLRTLLTDNDMADPTTEANRQMVQDLIASAVNSAIAKVQELVRDEMQKVTGGLNLSALPGLDKLMGG